MKAELSWGNFQVSIANESWFSVRRLAGEKAAEIALMLCSRQKIAAAADTAESKLIDWQRMLIMIFLNE